MINEIRNKPSPYYLADGHGAPRLVRDIDQELQEHDIMVVKSTSTGKIRIYHKGELVYGE
jgi:hypothetical protein